MEHKLESRDRVNVMSNYEPYSMLLSLPVNHQDSTFGPSAVLSWTEAIHLNIDILENTIANLDAIGLSAQTDLLVTAKNNLEHWLVARLEEAHPPMLP